MIAKDPRKIDIRGRLTLLIANLRHPKQRLIFQDLIYLMSTRCWFWFRVTDQPIATIKQDAFPSQDLELNIESLETSKHSGYLSFNGIALESEI